MSACWSGPGPPQSLADGPALGRALFARLSLHLDLQLVLSLNLLGKSEEPLLSWNSVWMNKTVSSEGSCMQSVPGLLPQHLKNGLFVRQRAEGAAISSDLGTRRIRVWPGKASGKRCIESCSEPQAFPLRSQELGSFLQAGGDAVLEGVFLASISTFSCRLVSFCNALKEVDCLLKYLSLLHSALGPHLCENIGMSSWSLLLVVLSYLILVILISMLLRLKISSSFTSCCGSWSSMLLRRSRLRFILSLRRLSTWDFIN